MRVEVRVPASSANLGPGFDILAVALGWYLTAKFETDGLPGPLEVTMDTDLFGGRNLVVEAMHLLARVVKQDLPRGRLQVKSDIPVARGLGSSSAALVAGLVLANEVYGRPLDDDQLFRLAAEWEGHGDNVGAALFGGAVLAVDGPNGACALPVPIKLPIVAVVLIPEMLGYTSDARAVLPRRVRRITAVRTAARTALLVLALSTGQGELLALAMEDELHQPYRAVLYPHLEEALVVARESGAYGAALSGAGPAVLAFAHPNSVSQVREAYEALLARRGLAGRVVALPIDRQGTQVSVDGDEQVSQVAESVQTTE